MIKIENVLQVKDPSGLNYFLGVINPAQIMELTFVPCVVKVNEDILPVRTTEGYQREGDPKRMTQIKEFYAKELTSLIPPVLLSTRSSWRFIPKSNGACFGHIEAEDCAAIIDGQHRLGGLSLLSQDESISKEALNRSIPFMAVDFPNVGIESNEFEVINGKQKGIKKSHLMYIRKDQSFGGNAAEMLKEDDESVFKSRIAIANRNDWDLITFQAAEDLVNLTFDNYFCTNASFRPENSEENKAKAMEFLLKYWVTISTIFPEMWEIGLLPSSGTKKSTSKPGRSKFSYRLLEETGLRAFAKLGSKIFFKAWIPNSQDIAWKNVEELLIKVSEDAVVKLVFQKITQDNRERIIAVDPKLQFTGAAGVGSLFNVLEGALNR